MRLDENTHAAKEELKRPSLKTAKRLGLTKYYNGKLCKRGHLSLRYVSSGVCISCARIDNQESAGYKSHDNDATEKRRAIEDHQSRKRDEYDF